MREKLQSDFVRNILEDLDLNSTFFKSLVPVTQPQPHYILLLDKTNRSPKVIAVELDKALSQSYHYRLARQLGQFSTVEVLVAEKIPEIMTLDKMKKEIKWGDIKHELLETQPIDNETAKNWLSLVSKEPNHRSHPSA